MRFFFRAFRVEPNENIARGVPPNPPARLFYKRDVFDIVITRPHVRVYPCPGGGIQLQPRPTVRRKHIKNNAPDYLPSRAAAAAPRPAKN